MSTAAPAPPKPPGNKSARGPGNATPRRVSTAAADRAKEIEELERAYHTPSYGGPPNDGGSGDSGNGNDDDGDAAGDDDNDGRQTQGGASLFEDGPSKAEAKRRRAEHAEFNDLKNHTNGLNLDDNFNYKQKDPTQKASGLRNRRNVISMGAAGGIIGLVLAAFGFLSPFKIPALMQAAADEAGQRVEQITIHRAKVIMARAILTKFGSPGGVVITGDGPVSSLIASLRTNKFEERLAKKGLVIVKTSDGVRLTMNGKPIGEGVLKNEQAIIDALDANTLTNGMLNDIVKEEIPAWRWMKRAKFAKWLRIKYGIPRYGIKNSEEKDPEKRVQEMQGDRIEENYNRMADMVADSIDCVMGEDNCVVKDGDKGIRSSNARQVADDIRQTGKELADRARQTKRAFMGRLQGQLEKTIIGKLGSKLIPIVGWIDLAATADHIAYTALEDDYFAKIPSFFRARTYAQAYGDWQGYSDQTKAGMLDPYFMGLLADQLAGAELSRAYNYINGQPDQGVGMNDDQKVNETNHSLIFKTWSKVKNIPIPIPGLPAGNSHFVLNIYYETLGSGGILGWLGDRVSNILGAIGGFLTPDAVEDWLAKATIRIFGVLGDLMGWMILDPLDTGAKLYNGLHAGARVSYDTYCHEVLHCRELTDAQASAQNQVIAQERSEYVASQGWAYATFSPEVTTSVTNKLAVALPSPVSNGEFNVDATVSGLASLISNMPSNAISALTPKTQAATPYVNLYNTKAYGATAADLNQPLAPEAMSGEPCPEIADGDFDVCTIDKEVAASILCNEMPDNESCTFVGSGGSTDQADSESETPSSAGLIWPIDLAKWPKVPMPIAECGLLYKDGTVHTGIDISVPTGTAVRAAADGVITLSNANMGALNIQTGLKDDSGKTLWLNYQHLSRRLVAVGDTVTRNQIIGESGEVGAPGAPHLHFSVWTTNTFLSGHRPPSASGNVLSQMKHPMNYLPEDGRKITECTGPPYNVPS